MFVVKTKQKKLSINLTLMNKLGLHTRPATLIVKQLAQFDSSVTFMLKGTCADAKSILHLLSLAAQQSDQIQVEVEGEDAEQVVCSLQKLFLSGFGEEQ